MSPSALRQLSTAEVQARYDDKSSLHVSHPLYDYDDMVQLHQELDRRKRVGRPSIGTAPMTPAQRKARSRALLAGSIAGEAALAKASIQSAMTTDFKRRFGGTPEADFLLNAIDAIARLEQLLAKV